MARGYADARSVIARACPTEPILMSMLLELARELEELGSQVAAATSWVYVR